MIKCKYFVAILMKKTAYMTCVDLFPVPQSMSECILAILRYRHRIAFSLPVTWCGVPRGKSILDKLVLTKWYVRVHINVCQ